MCQACNQICEFDNDINLMIPIVSALLDYVVTGDIYVHIQGKNTLIYFRQDILDCSAMGKFFQGEQHIPDQVIDVTRRQLQSYV